ncbi:MAG: hypothetical protein P8N09_04735, partial [Planctomycetota bacterium]|nr:hypothetical protein [Planctomycetota bacterium]
VATEGGCTVEYLGQHARYCQPDNPASIRRAVLEALEEPPSNSLRERIHTEFTWEQAARKMLKAYQDVTSQRARPPNRPAQQATPEHQP